MSSDDVPEGRCGFVLEPEDIRKEVRPDYKAESDEWYSESEAVCCWREEWDGSEVGRCVWHEDTSVKPVDALIEEWQEGFERLDGALIPEVDLGGTIEFDGCKMIATVFRRTGLEGISFEEFTGPFVQFVGTDLRDAQFSGSNLRYAQFLDAELLAAKFVGGTLHGTRIVDSNLRDTRFRDADLRGARFTKADLLNAGFGQARLPAARFDDVDLQDTQFDGADLRSSRIVGTYARNSWFRDAILRGTRFKRTKLPNARFSLGDLMEAEFIDAEIQNGRFVDAGLDGAQFVETDLEDARFTRADLRNADLTDTDVSDGKLTRVELASATFERTDLGDADLTDAALHDAHFLDVRINEGTTFGDVVHEEAVAHRLTNADGSARLPTFPYWLSRWRTDPEDRQKVRDKLDAAHTVYRTIQRLNRENSMPQRIDDYFVRAKETRRKRAVIDGDFRKWLYLAGQRWVMGYGERPRRVVYTSLAVIGAWTLLYPNAGGFDPSSGDPAPVANISRILAVPDVVASAVEPWLTSFYFSVVTFTTVGYGDLQPATDMGRLLASVETFLGALLMALLVYVLGRRATR